MKYLTKNNLIVARHQKRSHEALARLPFSEKAKMAMASYKVMMAILSKK